MIARLFTGLQSMSASKVCHLQPISFSIIEIIEFVKHQHLRQELQAREEQHVLSPFILEAT